MMTETNKMGLLQRLASICILFGLTACSGNNSSITQSDVNQLLSMALMVKLLSSLSANRPW